MPNKRMVSLKLFISTVIVLILLGILSNILICKYYEGKIQQIQENQNVVSGIENVMIFPIDGNIDFNDI